MIYILFIKSKKISLKKEIRIENEISFSNIK